VRAIPRRIEISEAGPARQEGQAMKGFKLIMAVGLGIGLLSGLPASVGAGGGSGAGGCVTTKPGLALRGTMGVEVHDTDLAAGGGAAVPIDAVLRIQKGGALSFFYASLVDNVGTNEQVVCAVLDILTPTLQTGLSLPGRSFCVNDRSLSNADSQSHVPDLSDAAVLAEHRKLTLGDVTVYAVQGSCN
jgi:hypothetical protein